MTRRLASISLTARLALGFVAVLAAAHVGICIYLDYALQAEFLTEDRRDPRSLGDFLKQVLRESTSLRAVQSDSRLQQAKALRPNMHFVVRDARGQIAESSYGVRWLLDSAASVQPLSGQVTEPLLTIMREGRIWRAVLSEARLADEERTAVAVVAAHDITDREAFATRYRARLAAAALGAAVVAGLVGLVLVRTALAPIGDMARRAGAISVYRLGERLPVDDVPRELRGLSVAFNETLERLEDSFRRLSQFSSDLAHDLRTPIGNLMGEAQVALRFPRSPEEYQDVLASARRGVRAHQPDDRWHAVPGARGERAGRGEPRIPDGRARSCSRAGVLRRTAGGAGRRR